MAGFDIESLMQVECEDGKLVVTPMKEVDYIDTEQRMSRKKVSEEKDRYNCDRRRDISD